MSEKINQYDIIGDIHGRWDKLEPLLANLGYKHNGKCHTHPDGRIAIFLGDLIDPKGDVPNGVREVLVAVKAMCDAGQAQCILGNHELHFVAYHTSDGDEGYLKPRHGHSKEMHIGTHASLDAFPNEREDLWLPWIKSLPFFIEFTEFRVVHACWHDESIELLRGKTLDNPDFLRACVSKGNAIYDAAEIACKGVEIPMPGDHFFYDKQGTKRTEFRARWWDRNSPNPSAKSMVFPVDDKFPDIALKQEDVLKLPGYGDEDKPVFIGHYYKPADSTLEPESENLYCLDFSAANGGPLSCYRWHGDNKLNLSGLVMCGSNVNNH